MLKKLKELAIVMRERSNPQIVIFAFLLPMDNPYDYLYKTKGIQDLWGHLKLIEKKTIFISY